MRKFSNDEINEIINYYKTHTATDTALHFHTHLENIKIILAQNNVELHSKEYNNKLKLEKTEQTCLTRYGCESQNQATIVKQHKANICLKKYGVTNVSKLTDIKLKKEATCLKHFGVLNPAQANEVKEKIVETCIIKYGETNPNKNRLVQEKVINTKFNRYGCIPMGQRFKVDNLYFHSFPELCLYLWCKANNIAIEREPVKLEYIVENKSYFYIPDFMINNQLVEIKGDQFLGTDGI